MLIGPPPSAIVRDDDGVLHVCGISGGKDSSAMALELQARHPSRPFIYLCTPTGNEPEAMFDHWLALGERLGSRVWPVTTSYSLVGLIKHYRALPNFRQRWCTRQLKIEPYGVWMATQAANGPVVSYIGIRFDEPEREGGDYSAIEGVTATFPMRDWEWALSDVLDSLNRRGVCIPVRTDCEWCYHQTLFEWYSLWANFPDRFAEGEALETEIGHTFRSPGRDTWPSSMADLRKRFEGGDVPKQRKRVTACAVCSR